MVEHQFIISYWGGPDDEKGYCGLAECGFNLAIAIAETHDEGRRALDQIQRAGMRALLADGEIMRLVGSDAPVKETLLAAVEAYASHPALMGYLITDEPHERLFGRLAEIHSVLRQLDPERLPLVNLLPTYAAPEQLGTIDYRTHVRRFVEQVHPLLLSYDHYALMQDGVDRPGYWANLKVIRDEALRAGVPFCNVVLSTPHFVYRAPSPEDMRWQVYSTLAYGGRGLIHFTYQDLDLDNFVGAPTTWDGRRRRNWGVLQQLNLEMQHLAPWLMGLTSTRVGHWPQAPEGTELLDGSGVVATVHGGEYVVGEYEDAQGRPWAMVMNCDRQRSAWATVSLKNGGAPVSEVARSTGTLRPMAQEPNTEGVERLADGGLLRFWLAPGDGRLFCLADV